MATFSTAIAASADDAREHQTGTVATNATYLSFAAAAQQVGLRFQSVTIPQGSTINSASITVYVNNATYDDPDLDIYGEDTDDAATFTTTNFDISGRTKTSATVAWAATGLGVGQKQSPDLATIIQEIIDRPGWASGNDLAIILTGQPSYAFEIAAYDSSDPEAEIDIDYTLPPATVTPKTGSVRLTTKVGGVLTQ